MLTLERSQVAHLISTGDTRWIHRGAYDLMDYTRGEFTSKMPPGRSLYGSLPAQLTNRIRSCRGYAISWRFVAAPASPPVRRSKYRRCPRRLCWRWFIGLTADPSR